jgi:[ribosomal protein S18]-alanine N-acetyltransferase
MSERLTFRNMRPDDLDAVVAAQGDAGDHPWPAAAVASELTRTFSRQLLAEVLFGENARVAGFAVYWLVAQEAQLLNLAVAPEFRRKNVGGRILEHACFCAANESATEMMLEVRKRNLAARRLYEKHQFVQVGLRRQYYQDDGDDAVLMRRRFFSG